MNAPDRDREGVGVGYIARDMDTALREALPYIATKYDAYAQWGRSNYAT